VLRRRIRRLLRKTGPHRVCFVVSSPRSGSTWLRTALSRHPDVLCTENRLFGDFFEVWNDERGGAPRMTLDYYVRYLTGVQDAGAMGLRGDALSEELVQRLCDQIFGTLAEETGKRVIVDKVTPYLGTSDRVVASIRRYFPDATIVQLVRDGRDVATSGAFDWLRKDALGTDRHAYFVEERPSLVLKRFFDESILTRWADYWVQPIRSLAEHRATAFTVRYEDMLADQARVLAGFFSRLGVDSDPAILRECVETTRFELMSGGRSRGDLDATAKVRRGVAGDWRNYFTREDGLLFQRLAGEELRRMGYESDDAWTLDLPDELCLEQPPNGRDRGD
jgi:hypothetical protein